MLRRPSLAILFVVLISLSGCGGDEPAATPTPLATFTPTAAPTQTPQPAATNMVETPGATQQSDVETPADSTPANADDVFVSPLAVPQSPLAVPDQVTLPEVTAAPAPPLVGSWQLQSIKPAGAMTATSAPSGYSLAFGRTGIVRVQADCRTGRGSYTRAADGALSLDITYSDAVCAPDSLADPFARALTDVTGYRFDGDTLLLTYGNQGGEMGLSRTALTAAFGAPYLSWNSLKNSTYLLPGTPPGSNQVAMVDGEFRAQISPLPVEALTTTAPAAADDEFVASLATMHTYAMLAPEETPEETAETTATSDAAGTPTPTPEPEVIFDSIIVVVAEEGETAAPKSYLIPVLNGGGFAIPLQAELLGENVFVRDLRWDGTQLTVDYDQGSQGTRRTYTFDINNFVLGSEEGLPPQPTKARLDLPAQAIAFAAGDGSNTQQTATLSGQIEGGLVYPYSLAAQAGQQLSVTLQSPFEDVWLSIYGANDHTVLRSIRTEANSWSGAIPSGQDYIISAVASGSASPYTLTLALAGQGQPEVQTQPPATPAPGKAVHLVIDGIPQPGSTLLDLLQRSSAQVDFFVTPAEAAQNGAALAELKAAGHGVGVIAGPITALTSDGRDALFAEISQVRQALGQGMNFCLRPPYAATDGYTRAAASEMGYDILLWDIDANSVTPEQLSSQLFPGAVIRFDGGDNSEQTVTTLTSLLPALAQQGYSVQSLCAESNTP